MTTSTGGGPAWEFPGGPVPVMLGFLARVCLPVHIAYAADGARWWAILRRRPPELRPGVRIWPLLACARILAPCDGCGLLGGDSATGLLRPPFVTVAVTP